MLLFLCHLFENLILPSNTACNKNARLGHRCIFSCPGVGSSSLTRSQFWYNLLCVIKHLPHIYVMQWYIWNTAIQVLHYGGKICGQNEELDRTKLQWKTKPLWSVSQPWKSCVTIKLFFEKTTTVYLYNVISTKFTLCAQTVPTGATTKLFLQTFPQACMPLFSMHRSLNKNYTISWKHNQESTETPCVSY